MNEKSQREKKDAEKPVWEKHRKLLSTAYKALFCHPAMATMFASEDDKIKKSNKGLAEDVCFELYKMYEAGY